MVTDALTLPGQAERVTEIEARQKLLVDLASEVGCEGILLLDPASVAWATAGVQARGIVDPSEFPAAYFQSQGRWLISGNTDSQRLFDEEADGLGFQLKEWAWNRGRSHLLSDLIHGRKIACDRTFGACPMVAERVRRLRRRLTAFDHSRLRELGKELAYALEATAWSLALGDSEQEIAGQIAHRLWRHGVEPIQIQVSADGRNRTYRRHAPGPEPVRKLAVLMATARRAGLHAMASRTMSFGAPGDPYRPEMEAACRLSAIQFYSARTGVKPVAVILAGEAIEGSLGFDHEWRLCPAGWLTGYAAAEMPLAPVDADEILEDGAALVLTASVGSALNADTAIVTETGAVIVTPVTEWPLKRARIGDYVIDRPDILVR